MRSLALAVLTAAAGCGTTTLGPPPPDRVAVNLSMGPRTGCLIDEESAVWCWDESFTAANQAPLARRLSVPVPLTELSVGFGHSCGLSAAGETWCWGDNTFGQLGVDGASGDVPVRVDGVPALAGVSAGGLHTCGWTAGGDAWCWGDNRYGQLGDESRLTPVAPVAVAGPYSFDAIDAGLNTTCGVTEHRIACWGDNRTGVVPRPDSVVSEPTITMESDSLSSVAVGQSHVCALATSGAVYCWGKNDVGQVGDGTTDARTAPVRVVQAVGWQSIDSGPRSTHTCARDGLGAVFCWGENQWAQSGVEANGSVLLPTLIATPRTYSAVSVGQVMSCSLDSLGGAFCWGSARQAVRNSTALRVVFAGS